MLGIIRHTPHIISIYQCYYLYMKKLIYIHDPMCSWCWGFSSALKQVIAALPSDVEVVRLLGGLAEDTDAPMPEDMQQAIASTWRRIEATIPGIKFNFDFWKACRPRRSTYPACRAVIAARQQGPEFDETMTQAIQRAYYQQARNPSDESTLIELVAELGLDVERFTHDLRDEKTQEHLLGEITEARRLGVDSFPSLLLQTDAGVSQIPIDYLDSESMLKFINEILSTK